MSDAPHPGVGREVLFTAEIPTPYGYVFRDEGNVLSRLRAGLNTRGRMLRSPCLAYVVRHPSAGVLLIDTGMHPDASTNLRKDFGIPMSLLFRGLQPAAAAFDQQLRAIGIEPEEVDRVVMTHLHVDHTSGMRLLPNATFICARGGLPERGLRRPAVTSVITCRRPRGCSSSSSETRPSLTARSRGRSTCSATGASASC